MPAVNEQRTPYLPLVGRSGVAPATLGWGAFALKERSGSASEMSHPTRRAQEARRPPHQGEGWNSLRRFSRHA